MQVVFEAPEAPDPPASDAPIAPMLLLPFVENAFKHGVSATQPSVITILLRQPQPDTLEFIVRNTLFAERAPTDEAVEPGGIGLVNTRRRLDLLYAGRYSLRVTPRTAANEYEVWLTLTLTDREAASRS